MNKSFSCHNSRSTSHHICLFIIVSLLLVQFFLRVHSTLELPISVDEYSHIERATAVCSLKENPVNFSQGKFLLYFWLALFRPETTLAGLFVSRAAIALFSLLTGAALAAMARDLFGWKTMLPSLAFYALAPHALFFERIVLADPLAAGLATIVGWQTFLLVKKPDRVRGAFVGLLISMAILAKLTTSFLFVLPVLSVLLFDDICSFAAFRSSVQNARHEFRIRYQSSFISALTVSAGILGIVLICILLSLFSGQTPVLFPSSMRLQSNTDQNFSQQALMYLSRQASMGNIFDRLFSLPMIVFLFLAGMVLVRQYRRQMFYVLVWLGLLWFPIMILSTTPRARYLMIGVPALAIIFGAGSTAIGNIVGEKFRGAFKGPSRIGWQSLVATLICVTLIVIWAAALAIPFAYNAIADPAEAKLPTLDTRNYLLGPSNAWGSREALSYLDAHGKRTDKGFVPVYAVLWRCYLAEIYLVDGFSWSCQNLFEYGQYHLTPEMFEWDFMTHNMPEITYIYVIAEGEPDWQTLSPSLHWQKVLCLSHPQKYEPICVWHASKS